MSRQCLSDLETGHTKNEDFFLSLSIWICECHENECNEEICSEIDSADALCNIRGNDWCTCILYSCAHAYDESIRKHGWKIGNFCNVIKLLCPWRASFASLMHSHRWTKKSRVRKKSHWDRYESSQWGNFSSWVIVFSMKTSNGTK